MQTPLFEQAFQEVARTIERAAPETLPPSLEAWGVLDRLRHPDRVIRFTVRWQDDSGRTVNTPAWRVQHCNALGPYKGGLRFSPDVDEDTLCFLAFEQCLKNALTGLPLGGGKGGAQFRPSNHSEQEVLRFCQAFIDEYVRYGGEDVDVPAGDIGVGPREIGWLFGRFAKLTGRHTGVFTGKPEELGGEVLSQPFTVAAAGNVVKLDMSSKLSNAWMTIDLGLVRDDERVALSLPCRRRSRRTDDGRDPRSARGDVP